MPACICVRECVRRGKKKTSKGGMRFRAKAGMTLQEQAELAARAASEGDSVLKVKRGFVYLLLSENGAHHMISLLPSPFILYTHSG